MWFLRVIVIALCFSCYPSVRMFRIIRRTRSNTTTQTNPFDRDRTSLTSSGDFPSLTNTRAETMLTRSEGMLSPTPEHQTLTDSYEPKLFSSSKTRDVPSVTPTSTISHDATQSRTKWTQTLTKDRPKTRSRSQSCTGEFKDILMGTGDVTMEIPVDVTRFEGAKVSFVLPCSGFWIDQKELFHVMYHNIVCANTTNQDPTCDFLLALPSTFPDQTKLSGAFGRSGAMTINFNPHPEYDILEDEMVLFKLKQGVAMIMPGSDVRIMHLVNRVDPVWRQQVDNVGILIVIFGGFVLLSAWLFPWGAFPVQSLIVMLLTGRKSHRTILYYYGCHYVSPFCNLYSGGLSLYYVGVAANLATLCVIGFAAYAAETCSKKHVLRWLAWPSGVLRGAMVLYLGTTANSARLLDMSDVDSLPLGLVGIVVVGIAMPIGGGVWWMKSLPHVGEFRVYPAHHAHSQWLCKGFWAPKPFVSRDGILLEGLLPTRPHLWGAVQGVLLFGFSMSLGYGRRNGLYGCLAVMAVNAIVHVVLKPFRFPIMNYACAFIYLLGIIHAALDAGQPYTESPPWFIGVEVFFGVIVSVTGGVLSLYDAYVWSVPFKSYEDSPPSSDDSDEDPDNDLRKKRGGDDDDDFAPPPQRGPEETTRRWTTTTTKVQEWNNAMSGAGGAMLELAEPMVMANGETTHHEMTAISNDPSIAPRELITVPLSERRMRHYQHDQASFHQPMYGRNRECYPGGGITTSAPVYYHPGVFRQKQPANLPPHVAEYYRGGV